MKALIGLQVYKKREGNVVPKMLDHKEVLFNFMQQKITINKKSLKLSKIEFSLFYIFVENANKKITRNAILKRIWDVEASNSHTLKVHIHRLRKKLFKVLSKKDFDIVAVNGTSYMLQIKDISKDSRNYLIINQKISLH